MKKLNTGNMDEVFVYLSEELGLSHEDFSSFLQLKRLLHLVYLQGRVDLLKAAADDARKLVNESRENESEI